MESDNEENPSNVYQMKSMPRGLALIINNANFNAKSGFGPRIGSELDVKNLENLFKYLGFKVFVKQDLLEKEIMKCSEEFKKQFEKDEVDMCIVCMMSHGRDGRLVDIDGVGMDIDAILIRFYDELLLGKPKLFLLQYCRGN